MMQNYEDTNIPLLTEQLKEKTQKLLLWQTKKKNKWKSEC